MVVRRYHHHGPAVLADQPQHHKGTPSLLTGEHQQQVQRVLEQAPVGGGLWTGPQVGKSDGWANRAHDPPQRGWESLKRLGFSLQVPRPPHHNADPGKPELFKRELPEQVREIQHAQVARWAMDEHRMGLKPVIRRVWARKGHRPEFVCNNAMHGSTCTDFFILKQERAQGCCCGSREYRGLQSCLSARCAGGFGWS